MYIIAQNMSKACQHNHPIHRSGLPESTKPQAAWWLSEDRHSIWVTPKGRDVLLHPLQGSDVVHEPVVPWKHGTVDPKGWDFFTEKIGIKQQ